MSDKKTHMKEVNEVLTGTAVHTSGPLKKVKGHARLELGKATDEVVAWAESDWHLDVTDIEQLIKDYAYQGFEPLEMWRDIREHMALEEAKVFIQKIIILAMQRGYNVEKIRAKAKPELKNMITAWIAGRVLHTGTLVGNCPTIARIASLGVHFSLGLLESRGNTINCVVKTNYVNAHLGLKPDAADKDKILTIPYWMRAPSVASMLPDEGTEIGLMFNALLGFLYIHDMAINKSNKKAVSDVMVRLERVRTFARITYHSIFYSGTRNVYWTTKTSEKDAGQHDIDVAEWQKWAGLRRALDGNKSEVSLDGDDL
jgi:hypothetical protein